MQVVEKMAVSRRLRRAQRDPIEDRPGVEGGGRMSDVFRHLFAAGGLREGSRSFRDYEAGKRLIWRYFPEFYETGVNELARYLCL
jgi:hypothetical protein